MKACFKLTPLKSLIIHINFVTYNNIDLKKWDLFIERSVNGSIYAWSWFLNSVCNNWSILVDDSFETALVIPEYKRIGFHYSVQPPPLRNLGLISTKKITPDTIQCFLQAIPGRFRRLKFYLNKYNTFAQNAWKVTARYSFEIDLIQKPEVITKNYQQPISNYFKHPDVQNRTLIKSLAPNDFIRLWRNTGAGQKKSNTVIADALRRIISRGIQNGCCDIYGVYSQFNSLIACGVMYYFRQKVTLLFFSQDQNDLFPLAFLLHHFILTRAGKDLTLSVEFLSGNERFSSFDKFPILSGSGTESLLLGMGFQKSSFPVIEKKTNFVLSWLYRTLLN